MHRQSLEPLILPDDSLSIPSGAGDHGGRTLICILVENKMGKVRYKFFDEGEIFWVDDHACLHYLNKGAIIVKGDML